MFRDTYPNLFDLFVVWGRDTIKVSSDLGAEVGTRDEGTENVFGYDIGEGSSVILDIVVRYVDMLQAEGKMGGGDGTNTPVGLAAEGGVSVIRRRHYLQSISMDVGGLRLHCSDLALSLRRLLQLGHLLTLDGGRSDLLAKDDVPNLAGCERGDVDAISLAKVS